ncbi:MAG UNVERIFIED_CONTAM: glycosyltransferase 87 family protein [Planctomycetaceae bacterium]
MSIDFLGTLAAMLYHFVLMRLPAISAEYPYNTFLFRPADRFNDFNILFRPLVHGIHPYVDSVYFPGSYVILYAFLPLSGYALFAYLSISLISTSILVLYTIQNRTIRERLYLLAALLVSYPMLFGLDRANLESLLLPLVLLWWTLRSKGYHFAAAMCLGLAGSTKLYPLLLLLPDLTNLRFRRLVMTSVFAMFFTLLGLLMMPGTIGDSIQMLAGNLKVFKTAYVYGGAGWYNSVSALSMAKTVNFLACSLTETDHRSLNRFMALNWNFVVCAGLAGMLWGGWKLRHQHEWKSILVAAAAMILLPTISGDYKLLHLVLPFILFLNADPDKNDRKITFIFALLLVPKSYVFVISLVSIAVVLNPLLLIILLAPVLRGQEVRRHISQTADVRACRHPTNDLMAAYGLQNSQ